MLKPAAIGLLLALTAAAAQAAAPPARPEPPNPLARSLVDAQGHVTEAAVLPAPDDPAYRDLDGAKMKALAEEVVAISRKDRDRGALFWGRNLGTQGHIDAEDWAMAKFRALGLKDVRKQTVAAGDIWTPKAYEIGFTVGGEPLRLASARPAQTTPTPKAGLDLELVWGGMGSEADLRGRDIKGKAVLIQNNVRPSDRQGTAYQDRAVQRAFSMGAALVGRIYGVQENYASWDPVDGGPGFNVGYEDGLKLRDAIGSGKPVRLRYSLDSTIGPGLPTSDVYATLPGAGPEEVMLVAHLDGYFEGAIDNASGLAVMVAMAEHYARIPQARRPRTIRFVAAAGHHGGGVGTLPVHQTHDFSKTAWIVNLEHVTHISTRPWGSKLRLTTAVDPMRWVVRASPRATRIVIEAFRRYQVPLFAEMEPRALGEIAAIAQDAPSIEAITGPEHKHTEQDTIDWVPAAGLERIARAHARIIDDLSKLSLSEIRPAP